MSPDRRTFLKSIASATAGLMVPVCDVANPRPARDRLGDILPLRRLGRTGEAVTMLGLGGAHIEHFGDRVAPEIIETAIEGGVRFFDNAQLYGPSKGEELYGKYLCPKYRDIIFLMTKTYAKDGATALKHLEGSLRRMKTDYVDLWQIHALKDPADVDNRIEQGVLDVVLKAKESGKVKHIGFTGHSSYQAHLRMLEQTKELETCMMPINVFDLNYKSFITNVLPVLVEREMGVIAMKTLANGGFFGGKNYEAGDNPKLIPGTVTIQEALHFVWSLPVSVLVTGANSAPMLQEKINLCHSFSSLEADQRLALIDRVSSFDGTLVENYKI